MRLSIRAVARAAGVTPPAVYRHFADRRSLFVAVPGVRGGPGPGRGGAATPFDVLHRRCMAYLAFARDHPGHYQALFKASSLGPRGLGTYERRPHPGAASFNALVAEPIRVVRHELGLPVGVVNPGDPRKRSRALLDVTFFKQLRPSILPRCQLPDELTDRHGTIRKPDRW